MNINELVASIEATVESARDREDTAKREVNAIIDGAKRDQRAYLSQHETARTDALFADIERAKSGRRRCEERLTRAREVQADEARIDAAARDIRPTAADARLREGEPHTATYSVTRNERTYSKANDPSGRNFLLDVARATAFNDVQAQDRLTRHSREEMIERPGYATRVAGDATTTAFGVGLVVPQYLTDYYAPAIAAMRPVANIAAQHPLPAQGMTLNLSRITTPTSAALQAAQLSAVSTTSIAETDLAINVQTVAGSQNVSRQAIERGTGIEDVTAGDLFKRVATAVDAALLTQASTGIQASAQGVTYTSASPTGPEFYPYVFQAQSKLEQALLAQARVDYVVMHPRRFNWLASQVGSTFPFLGQAGSGIPAQTYAMQVTNEYGADVRAVLANGLKVIVDANVPTNTGGTQDEVYVLASQEVHIWEDQSQPLLIRAEQPNAANLGILLVAYQYMAYTVGRYANNPSKITGTGLAAPAGF